MCMKKQKSRVDLLLPKKVCDALKEKKEKTGLTVTTQINMLCTKTLKKEGYL